MPIELDQLRNDLDAVDALFVKTIGKCFECVEASRMSNGSAPFQRCKRTAF
jgi:hypothetical protein